MSFRMKESASSRFNLGLFWSRIRTTSGFNAAGVMELKQDSQATAQAVGVLVLATISYGIGYTILTETQSHSLSVYGIIVGGMANMIASCFSTVVWSIAVFFVGTKLFHGTTRYWELARPLFFSTAPALLFILISIPFRPIIVTVAVVVTMWLVISQTFVVKHVMGFNLQRTVLTLMVGFLILAFLGLQFSHT
jgi:hypothetical protein